MAEFSMTSRMASSLDPSSEKTSPMRLFTTSRDKTYGGTAVAVPAMVATALTILFLILVRGSCRLARTSSTSTDFGVRVDDNVRLLWTPAPVEYSRSKRYPAPGLQLRR